MQRAVTQGGQGSDSSFKPIGFALAAVVAGLAPMGAESFAEAPAPTRDAPTPEPIDYAAEQDNSLLLGPSEAVEPFAEPVAPLTQGDLFDL